MLFNELFSIFNDFDHLAKIPGLNFKSKILDGKILLQAELPGYSEKDIVIDVHDNLLSIRGKMNYENKDEFNKWFNSSISKFEKHFTLPRTADESEILAELKNGILQITIPIKKQLKEGKRIEIKVLPG